MKKLKSILFSLIFLSIISLASCDYGLSGSSSSSEQTSTSQSTLDSTSDETSSKSSSFIEKSLTIINKDISELTVGETLILNVDLENLEGNINWISSNSQVVTVNNGEVSAVSKGSAEITAELSGFSDSIIIDVINNTENNTLLISADKSTIRVGETALISYVADGVFYGNLSYSITSGNNYATLFANSITGESAGTVTIIGSIGNFKSNIITIDVIEALEVDPYSNISETEFYNNYTTASSYLDSYYRSEHYFMSGTIEDQDETPTIEPNQPKEGNYFIRNSGSYYSQDNKAYYVVNSLGEVSYIIYDGGAYITLEEVAAYTLAFANAPSNYVKSTSTKPTSSPWKEYLRVNINKFSGNTSQYPYEPALPDISGINGGTKQYYEIDIGTTYGTTSDIEHYEPEIYNDGTRIVRGAARIVFTMNYTDGRDISDINERYTFYTYNHYNDFQEYLNYENGWGEKFGNITGGGKLDSGNNPSPYVNTVSKSLFW